MSPQCHREKTRGHPGELTQRFTERKVNLFGWILTKPSIIIKLNPIQQTVHYSGKSGHGRRRSGDGHPTRHDQDHSIILISFLIQHLSNLLQLWLSHHHWVIIILTYLTYLIRHYRGYWSHSWWRSCGSSTYFDHTSELLSYYFCFCGCNRQLKLRVVSCHTNTMAHG